MTEIYAPQRRYEDKQIKAGHVRISAWVPEGDRDRALNYCAKLRKDAQRKQSVRPDS